MARLTEQEKQEIIRFIEADKPMPDKYRFLLFEEKREVELVWTASPTTKPWKPSPLPPATRDYCSIRCIPGRRSPV